MLSNKKKYILRWLETLKIARKFKPLVIDKLCYNTYSLFFLLFKFLIFKDVCILNYKLLIYKYNFNIYSNIIECRFYFVFFFILIRNNLFDFLIFLFSNREEYNQCTLLSDNKNIFFFNKYIFLFIYLLKYLNYFFIRFNKFKYYKNFRWFKNKYINTYSNFFLFKEFKLKVDHNSFFLYRKYINFFRLAKYNEYLANHAMFSMYPKLKYILHIFFKRLYKSYGSFRLNTILNYYNIYKLNTANYLNNKNYKLQLKNYKYNTDCDLLLNRSLNLNNILFLKQDNSAFYLKCYNHDLFRFFEIIKNNKSLTVILLKFSYIFLSIYIAHACYNIYSTFILRIRRIRRLKCRHFVSLHWKFTKLNFQFLLPLYKIFYKFYTHNLLNQHKLINYGFLSFYFLDNNLFLKNNIKKHILLYRITNILVIEYISILFEHLHKDLSIEAHKAKAFSQPNILKMWNINLLNYLKKKNPSIIAPIDSRVSNIGNRFIHSIPNHEDASKNLLNINYFYFSLWNIIYKWSISTYLDILNLTKDSTNFLKIFSNYKYSFEFISWEILNSNNNKYLLNKYFLNFNYFLNYIRIENIISFYSSKYAFNILQYFNYYPKDFMINTSFSYFFIRDFFFRILSKKNKVNNIKYFLSKKRYLINNYYFFYYRFFNWNMQTFLSWQRYLLFYSKYRFSYYTEYTPFYY